MKSAEIRFESVGVGNLHGDLNFKKMLYKLYEKVLKTVKECENESARIVGIKLSTSIRLY
jgi:hypothetical protein